MAKHFRCRGYVNGRMVTYRTDADNEMQAIEKFRERFVSEGVDPAQVTRVVAKEKEPPKGAGLRFGRDPNAPVPTSDPTAESADTPQPKASKPKGKRSRK